jgi:hypothetical protein
VCRCGWWVGLWGWGGGGAGAGEPMVGGGGVEGGK